MRCHKMQGMTEAFTDTLYSRAKTSSSVHQKAVFTAFLEARQQISLPRIMLSKKSFRHALHLVTAAPPPPESSCSRSSYSRFLVSELKYAFPYIFRTARARVSRNLNLYLAIEVIYLMRTSNVSYLMYLVNTPQDITSLLLSLLDGVARIRGGCAGVRHSCNDTSKDTAAQARRSQSESGLSMGFSGGFY